MTDLLSNSEFVRRLREYEGRLGELEFRWLVFQYCRLYQEVYCFEQLENAFAYLELTRLDLSEEMSKELSVVRAEVAKAMGEYFESLNEVAAAVYRLLDETPMTVSDTIAAVGHVWNAHACNEQVSMFRNREDMILCGLVAELVGRVD